MQGLDLVGRWPVDAAAAAVVTADGVVVGSVGDQGREFPLASVTKLLTAYAVLVAVEEGAVEWDQQAGPATVRHLIAHTAGLAFDTRTQQAEPGTRRIYSNAGFEVLAETITEATSIPFATYLTEAVFDPLGMVTSSLPGSAGAGGVSTCADLTRFAAELQRPTLVSPETLAAATTVAFPGLNGVLPGYGMQKPNDWGLGFEIRDHKSPHWTGKTSSPETYGHFGQSGTFLWVDPTAKAACVTLTTRPFGDWAIAAWPPFTDAILHDLATR
ncbi:serine hydrolase domain-containing protein [Actinokineospora auranticolor]|uniref:CubicO group peptidase (Beta-lactamase class C family) n=1 Tax=Actinokineospora auranticolor TaxID=155976 RepID=A0A2S6GZG7_9PSEU|nr:serine hydrolase domain-containing protein [Actinokineospora auranticolor]PPK70550.1 CubicO group peptidase (beta-lactamase class C family) [Actinokineospora auranticolor]